MNVYKKKKDNMINNTIARYPKSKNILLLISRNAEVQ